MLRWLWTDVAEPVISLLEAEGLLSSADGSLPRMWWCPAGCLSFLPVHAAGQDGMRGSSVTERAVSSYVITLSQLIRARQRARRRRDPGILIVAPARDLAFAKPEAELVASHFSDYKLLEGGSADAGTFAKEIANYPYLHFAGHGAAAQRDPKTGFSFAGGLQIAGEGEPAFLSARVLSDMPAADSEFAFLSVCDAATPDVSLVDEAMHPAAVLHFGGYRHVIGTLQPVVDAQAPAVADAVYARLMAGEYLDAEESARALHHTVRELRRAVGGKPGLWASYIHIGP
jgi:CHAT domain-containing protein